MDEKKNLIDKIRGINGRDPVTLNEMLSLLAHPEVVSLAKAYLQVKDNTDACKKYQAPWNCAMEAQAFAQTVYNGGWSTSMADVMEDWCVNCQARLYGEDPGDLHLSPEIQDWLEDPTVGINESRSEELENPWVSGDVDGC